MCVCVFVCACASVFSNPKAAGVRVDETNLLSIERMSSSVQWLLSGTTVALPAPLSEIAKGLLHSLLATRIEAVNSDLLDPDSLQRAKHA